MMEDYSRRIISKDKLKKLAIEFLECNNFYSENVSENAVLFKKTDELGIDKKVLVYFYDPKKSEDEIKDEIKELEEKFPLSKEHKFFLSPVNVRLGIAKDFTVQTPVLFFDRDFSSYKSNTTLKKFEKEIISNIIKERIEQPFKFNNRLMEEDILNYLFEKIWNAKESSLKVIIAPAGYGKTVLMAALYDKMRREFMEKKKHQELSIKPLLMISPHIRGARNIDELINNFTNEEYEWGVCNANVFKFWVRHNFAVWLLDGVEELIMKAGEDFIYDLMNDFITNPDADAPQIVISIRSTILTTQPDLRDAISEWEGDGLEVYELCEWRRKQKVVYFDKNLKVPQEEKEEFKKELDRSPTLNKICGVPYFCKLIADLKNSGKMASFNDECELIEHFVKSICEREFEKGLDKELFPVEKQMELFEWLLENALSSKQTKISTSDLKDIAEIFIEKDVNLEVKKKQLTCIFRHPLLISAGENEMEFIHEIIKDYFLGVVYYKSLKNKNYNIFDALEIEEDTVYLKFLRKKSYRLNWDDIIKEIQEFSAKPSERALQFRNILKIYLISDKENKERLLKNILSNRNLSGLIFKDLDLSEFSFENSKLENTCFKNCKLIGANFNKCYFKNTLFDDKCVMDKMTIKGAFLDSIRTNGAVLDTKEKISEFFYKRTSISQIEREGPCEGVINLIKILKKIIRKGKGAEVPRNFLVKTKLDKGDAAEYVDTLIKYGLLKEIRKDYLRIPIEYYKKLERFIKNPLEFHSEVKELKEILDRLCPNRKKGCKHFYS